MHKHTWCARRIRYTPFSRTIPNEPGGTQPLGVLRLRQPAEGKAAAKQTKASEIDQSKESLHIHDRNKLAELLDSLTAPLRLSVTSYYCGLHAPALGVVRHSNEHRFWYELERNDTEDLKCTNAHIATPTLNFK